MEGEVLEVSGVSVKLVPQTNDTFVIEPGTYDLLALEGSGNVQSDNGDDYLNEIMSPDADEYHVDKYANYTFVQGEVLTVSGVSIQVVGELPSNGSS